MVVTPSWAERRTRGTTEEARVEALLMASRWGLEFSGFFFLDLRRFHTFLVEGLSDCVRAT